MTSLLDGENLNVEGEGGIRADTPGREPRCAIGLISTAHEAGRLAELHRQAPDVPASNHLLHANVESEGLLAGVLGAAGGGVSRTCQRQIFLSASLTPNATHHPSS